MTDDTAHALHLEVDLAAPVRRVWTALTTTYGLRAWWWAEWEDVRVSVEARVGGTYRIEAHGAGIVIEGEYTDVDRASGRLAFTWVWSDSNGTSVGENCTLVVSPLDSGCRISLDHTGPWADSTPVERYRSEWTTILAQLRGAVEVTRLEGCPFSVDLSLSFPRIRGL